MEQAKLEKLFEAVAAFFGVDASVRFGPVADGYGEICWDGMRYAITIAPDIPQGVQYRNLLHECSHALLEHVVHEVQTPEEKAGWNERYHEWHESGKFPPEYHRRELEADALADQLIAELAGRMGCRTNLHIGLKLPEEKK